MMKRILLVIIGLLLIISGVVNADWLSAGSDWHKIDGVNQISSPVTFSDKAILNNVGNIIDQSLWEEFEPQQDAAWLTDCDLRSVDGTADGCSLFIEAVFDGSRYIYTVSAPVLTTSPEHLYLIRYDTWKRFVDINSWAKFDIDTVAALSGETSDVKLGSFQLIGTDLYILPEVASPFWVKYDTTLSFTDAGSYTVYVDEKALTSCNVDSYLQVLGHGIAVKSSRYVRLNGTSGGSGACGLTENQEYYVYALNANRLMFSTSYPFVEDESILSCSGTSDTVVLESHNGASDEARMLLSIASACYNVDGIDSIIANHTYYLCSCSGTSCKLQDTASGPPDGAGECTSALNLQCTDGAGCTETIPSSDTVTLTPSGAGQPLTASPVASGSLQTEFLSRRSAVSGSTIYTAPFDSSRANFITKFATATSTFTLLDIDSLGLGIMDFFGAVPTHDGFGITFTPYTVGEDTFLYLDTSVTFNSSAFTSFDAYSGVVGKTDNGYHGGWEDDYYAYYLPYGDGASVYNGTILRRDKSKAFDDSTAWSVVFDTKNLNANAVGYWSVLATSDVNDHYVYMTSYWSGSGHIPLVIWNTLGDPTLGSSYKYVDLTTLANDTGEGKGVYLLKANGYLYLFTTGSGSGKGGNVLRFPIERLYY